MPKTTSKTPKNNQKPKPGRQKVGKFTTPTWDDQNYVRAHEFARSGLTNAEVGDALGAHPLTWKRWLAEKPALQAALDRGRAGTGGGNYLEYVYGRLPARLQQVWDELRLNDESGRPVEFIDDILDGLGEKELQVLWLHALITENFNAMRAHKAVNVSEKRVAGWLSHDPGFAEIAANLKKMRKDFCEGALMDLVARGDTAAVIFANRTLNRDRGYDPKVTVDHNHTVTGGLLHARVELESLDGLPPEEQRKILDAIRSARKKVSTPPRLPPAEIVTENLAGED